MRADLLGLGVLLRDQPGDLLLQLLDALLQLIFLPEPRRAPQIEQLALAGDRLFDVGIVDASASSRGTATVSAPSRSAPSRALRA